MRENLFAHAPPLASIPYPCYPRSYSHSVSLSSLRGTCSALVLFCREMRYEDEKESLRVFRHSNRIEYNGRPASGVLSFRARSLSHINIGGFISGLRSLPDSGAYQGIWVHQRNQLSQELTATRVHTVATPLACVCIWESWSTWWMWWPTACAASWSCPSSPAWWSADPSSPSWPTGRPTSWSNDPDTMRAAKGCGAQKDAGCRMQECRVCVCVCWYLCST